MGFRYDDFKLQVSTIQVFKAKNGLHKPFENLVHGNMWKSLRLYSRMGSRCGIS